VIVFGRF
jgi:hypothetical protein